MAQANAAAPAPVHGAGGGEDGLAAKIAALREGMEVYSHCGVVIEPDGLAAICDLLRTFEDEARQLQLWSAR